MKRLCLLVALCVASASCAHNDDTPEPKPLTNPKPVAGFTILESVQGKAALILRNTSAHSSGYTLAWGDGATSADTTTRISHTYYMVGKVRVRMTATGPGGTDTISKALTITSPPAPTDAAGRYRGRLYYSYFDPFSPSVSWQRDTIIQFSQVSPTSLLVFGVETFYVGAAATWYGHNPARYSSTYSRSVSGGRVIFQKAWDSDSLYADGHIGGRAGGSDYKFYGKKL